MIDLGLSSADLAAYTSALHYSYDVRSTVHVLDRNEDFLFSLSTPIQRVIDGMVMVDAGAQVKRSLTMTLLDPTGEFSLDPRTPSTAALFVDNLIRVRHETYVPALNDWIECPIFCGPITGLRRDGPTVWLEAQGKEVFALEPEVYWNDAETIKKGANVVATIRTLMESMGERRFDMDASSKKLPTNLSIGRHDEVWKHAKKLASGIDRHLFYDGRGRLRLRKYPKRTLFTWYTSESGDHRPPIVLNKPQVTYNLGFRNRIEVLGANPKGKKPRIRALAGPDSKHALSPESLARNGEKRYLVETIENDKIKRKSDAQAIANRVLDDRLRIGVDVTFETLPIPMLEENDRLALVTKEGTHEFRLRQFTIPLTATGTMSVGYLKRPRVRKKKK